MSKLPIPTFESERLRLRPFTFDDAETVENLAGDKAIAATVLNIPHPYEKGMAREWIKTHEPNFLNDIGVNFAITLKSDGSLIGSIGLIFDKKNEMAEVGYWIGLPYWGQGYCTEAGKLVLAYAFDEQRLNRVYAQFMHDNPASGRVMAKLGMKPEGILRQHQNKWGMFKDMHIYGILASEYEG